MLRVKYMGPGGAVFATLADDDLYADCSMTNDNVSTNECDV